jgi:cell division protein FtsB
MAAGTNAGPDRIARLEAEVATLRAEIEELRARIAELQGGTGA